MSENGASIFPAYSPTSRAESLSKLDHDEVCIPFSPHGEQSSIAADSELDHVSQAVGLESKAEELFNKFGKNEDPQLIIVAIDMLKKTLELLPNDLTRRKRTYGNLSTLLTAYFQCSGDVAALDEALNFDRIVLDMLPFGDPGRPSSLASLARTLTVYYEAFGVVALLNEGIEMMKEAIQQDIDAESDKDPIDACSQLIHMLSLRYKASGDHEILDDAVRIARIVLEACTDAHPLRGKAYTNLSVLLMLKYESLGDIGILEEAIIFSRTAVNLAEEAPDKAIWLNNLAAALGLLYEAKGDTTLLDEIVVLENIARDLRPSGHPCHLTACTNLANARKAQYDTLGSYALLDEAIELERMVLRSTPLGDPHRSLLCSNLATSLGKRYETSGDLAFLHESIKLEREALTQRPEGHPERGTSCGNLGAWIYIRYRSSQNLDHLQEAVTLMRTALLLRNPAHGNHASLCIQLSIALRRYYDHTSNDATVLEEAVQLSQKAFIIRSSDHPDYGDACLTHAMALTHYDEVMDNTNHFDEIMALCQKGLPLLSNHRAWIPLLMLARMSVVSRGRQVDIHKAINYVKEAVAKPPCDIIGLAKNASLTLSRIHRLVLTNQQWAGLLPAYTHLIRILPLLASFALDRRTQLHSQLPVTHLGSDAVTSAIAARDFPAGLELLEQSRGVIWTQALHVSDPQTQGLPEELQVELRELLVSMAADTASIVEHASGGPNTSDLRHRRATRIQALLYQIRSMPGLERFMLGESHECLMQAAKDHLVVILIATRRASYALVLRDSTSLVYVPLEVRAKDIVQLWTLNGSSMSRGSLPLDRRGMKLSSGKVASRVELSLARIWSRVVQPIVSHLQLEVCFDLPAMSDMCLTTDDQ
jgi:tetratricopeptide (TPR) repeat protein